MFTQQLLAAISLIALVAASPPPAQEPALARIDEVVRASIERRELPGAVVTILHKDHIVFHKAFGHSILSPEIALMDLAALFDLASLTKPIATATSIMLLLEDGKLRL